MACIHAAQKGSTRETGRGNNENGKFIQQESICRKCNVVFERKIYPFILADMFSIPKGRKPLKAQF